MFMCPDIGDRHTLTINLHSVAQKKPCVRIRCCNDASTKGRVGGLSAGKGVATDLEVTILTLQVKLQRKDRRLQVWCHTNTPCFTPKQDTYHEVHLLCVF